VGDRTYPLSKEWRVVFHCKDIDVTIIDVPVDVWGVLGVKALEMGEFAPSNQVFLRGRDAYGTLSQSYGMAHLDTRNPFGVKYKVWTAPGWSGTPVLQGGKVVGVHRGTDATPYAGGLVDYNNGSSLALLLIQKPGRVRNLIRATGLMESETREPGYKYTHDLPEDVELGGKQAMKDLKKLRRGGFWDADFSVQSRSYKLQGTHFTDDDSMSSESWDYDAFGPRWADMADDDFSQGFSQDESGVVVGAVGTAELDFPKGGSRAPPKESRSTQTSVVETRAKQTQAGVKTLGKNVQVTASGPSSSSGPTNGAKPKKAKKKSQRKAGQSSSKPAAKPRAEPSVRNSSTQM